MKINSKIIIQIFQKSIQNWHFITENQDKQNEKRIQQSILELKREKNELVEIEKLLYEKNQIDTIQWHIEDEIRRQDISVTELLSFKRQIDRLNQNRTDKVENLDHLIFNEFYPKTKVQTNAKMNSETPAWLIDRISILELKIYHMKEQTERKDADNIHIEKCQKKLEILLEQRKDLAICLDELLEDLKKGTKYFKVYKQMKMYNDNSLNPALYKNK